MPIKTGDELRFNVLTESSNTLTNSTVSVGLFDENFRFIANVGEATSSGLTILKYTFDLPLEFEPSCTVTRIALFEDEILFENQIAGYTQAVASSLNVLEFLQDLVANLTIGTAYYEPITDGYRLYWTITNWPFEFIPLASLGKVFTFGPLTTWANCFQGEIACIETPTQKQARVTIPATQNGCYRFGLYKFGITSEGVQAEWLLQAWLSLYKCMAILDSSGNVIWLITIKPDLPDWNSFIQWFKLNAPFGDVTLQGTDIIYTVYPYINSSGWTLEIGDYDFSTNTFSALATADEQSNVPSPYAEDISEVYSFSNLLRLDNSDCFSSILNFWGDNNSIAEGFEYYNDWFQQIRLGINGGGKKPIINESTYRQSNGVFRRPSNKQDYSIDLHTDFLDLNTQQALVDATRHPNFVYKGESLFVNGEIEVATVQDFTTQSSFEDLAQVKFSALIQGYQPKNSTCINC
jgi:hypothetical protein